MKSNIILDVQDVSKQYRLGEVGTGTISHDLNRWWAKIRGKEDPFLKIGETNDRTSKGISDYVWALKDINFQIEQGQAVGIIGRNGAGKSTLLKLLSKVTKPTTGEIKVKGRIASLLEVGTGFNPQMTGRENIFLNGAILGMTRKEIARKFDEIVDFAGVDRYIDTPVKRYSSGMYVRLAFSVAAHLESEILIVDEVLAVGDAEFQKKCLGKMGDVTKGEGRTVLFVSHNMAAVQNLCDTGIMMLNGTIDYQGNIQTAIDHYLKGSSSVSKIEFSEKKFRSPYKTHLKSIELLNSKTDEAQPSFKMGEDIKVRMTFKMLENFNDLGITLRMSDVYGSGIAAWRTKEMGVKLNADKEDYTVDIIISGLNVFDGFYNLSFSMINGRDNIDIMGSVLSFEIIPAEVEIFKGNAVIKSHNLIYTPAQWIAK